MLLPYSWLPAFALMTGVRSGVWRDDGRGSLTPCCGRPISETASLDPVHRIDRVRGAQGGDEAHQLVDVVDLDVDDVGVEHRIARIEP